MEYVKVFLSGVAGIMLPLIGLTLCLTRGEKATGIAVLAAPFYDLRFWAFATLLFALFFAASRLQNKLLRGLLFWTPTVVTTLIGSVIFGFIMYAYLSRPRS